MPQKIRIAVTLFSLSSHAVRVFSLFSFSFYFHVAMQQAINYIWRISNLCCRSFCGMVDDKKNNLVGPVYYNKAFSIVCGEPITILWYFLKNIAHYLSWMVHYKFPASVGFAYARPNQLLI